MDLSVIIPVYNAEKTLKNSLESLMHQGKTDFSWEIVAVNDGSTDGSLAILREYEQKAKDAGIPFRVLTRENRGVARTRNEGLDEASGECVLYLDADDILYVGALQKAMTKKREKKAQILLFDSEYLYADKSTSPLEMARHPGGRMNTRDYMLSEPCPWNKVIDKDLFTQNGFRFKEDIWYEDFAVIPALGTACREDGIYYLKETLHRYFQSENSITRSAYSEKKRDIFPALEALMHAAKGRETEVEYLAWLHLYRNFAWIFWEAGDLDAIRKANAFMKKNFPNWKKNPLIRQRHTTKEHAVALLFYGEWFWLIRIWKGKQK